MKLIYKFIARLNAKFYSSHWFSKNQIFSFFSIVKMAAKYARIDRVGSSNACFKII